MLFGGDMKIDEQISFRKLEILLSFIKHGGLSHVAEDVGQSTVSVHRALHSLEEALGCPLFQRNGRRLQALPAAHVLAEHAARSLQECADGILRAREIAGVGGSRLRVGGLYSLTVRTIPHLFIGLRKRRPSLDVELTLSSNRTLLEKLETGHLDAIIIAIDETPSASMLHVPMFSDEMFFAAPLGSPYAKFEQIDLRQVSDEGFVCLSEDFATQQSFLRAFERAGCSPRITMQVGDIFSLVNLVSGGVGHALLPGRIADFGPKIQLIPLASPYLIRQQISLLFLASRERDPNLLALSAECRMFSTLKNP